VPSISPNLPSVTITLDKPRNFRFSWSACNRFEEAYGMNLPRAFVSDRGVRLFTYLAWAGLLEDEPTLKVAQVEKRFDRFIANGGNLGDFTKAIMKAMTESGVIGREEPADKAADDEDAEGNDQPGPAPSAE
jgi:hypothetical protein